MLIKITKTLKDTTDFFAKMSENNSIDGVVDFLSEALYLSDVHNEAYLDATIRYVDDNRIDAVLHGIKVRGFEVVEIKAVTYHDLRVEQIDGVWQADIVFDI